MNGKHFNHRHFGRQNVGAVLEDVRTEGNEGGGSEKCGQIQTRGRGGNLSQCRRPQARNNMQHFCLPEICNISGRFYRFLTPQSKYISCIRGDGDKNGILFEDVFYG